MRRPASLTRRLILWLGFGAALLWLAGALVAAAVLRHQLSTAFDSGLRETAERLLPLAAEGLGELRRETEEGEEAGHEVPLFDERGGEYIVYQVRRGDGALLLRSHDAPALPFETPLAEGFGHDHGWRIFTIGTADGALFIHVAESERHRADALLGSVVGLVLPIVALVPLAAIGIFFVVRRALAPLRAFSAEIGRRDARNLAPIDTGGLPAELVPTADAVQALIARLAAALDAERALAANSAHELRTPIAGSLAQTQRLVAELSGQPTEARARQVEESLRRLRRLSEKLLELARADAGMAAAPGPVDLMPALGFIVEDARRHAADPGRLQLAIAPAATLRAPLDLDAFGIAMRNLIENAMLHGDPAGPVIVAVPESGVVEVTNAGPAVPPERLATLSRRFARGDTRAGGSGLGLAIVEQILAASGGRLRLASPAAGRDDGFTARLELPDALRTVARSDTDKRVARDGPAA